MENKTDFKKVASSLFEKGKELGGKAINNAKTGIQTMNIKNKLREEKVKLGDIIYQADIQTGVEEIEELKRMIKSSLEELNYLETKKSK